MTTARSSREERRVTSITLSNTFQIFREGLYAPITHSAGEQMTLPMEIMSIISQEGPLMIQNLLITESVSRGLAQGIQL